MSKLLELQNELTDLYASNSEQITSGSSALINKHRDLALKNFSRLGIPSRKTEAYKYTDLEPYLTRHEYAYDLAPADLNVDLDALFSCDIPELDTHVVLVLNGFYYTSKGLNNLPEGVIVMGLSEASKKHPELVEQHYGKYANTEFDSLAALNTAFSQDGVFIYVPKNVILEKPIQIINIGHSFKNLRITRRNLFVAEQSSQLSILVCDHTLCEKSFITNSLTEVYVGENAQVELCKMQNENGKSSQISNTFIHQKDNSNFSSNTLALHGGLIRNNQYAMLDGQGIDHNAYGLFLCDNQQHVANYIRVHHAQPNCTSDQLFKGVLDDKSTGAFNGMIYVDKGASKTEAFQRNNNILLEPTAKMNTKPQLEIYNDDVKCSHGATVGQLDTEGLFYLRSRGIGLKEAKHLMMYAFADEVISKIKLEPLRERMTKLVDKRLRGELSACENCHMVCK